MIDYTMIIIQSFGLGFTCWLLSYGLNRVFLTFKGILN